MSSVSALKASGLGEREVTPLGEAFAAAGHLDAEWRKHELVEPLGGFALRHSDRHMVKDALSYCSSSLHGEFCSQNSSRAAKAVFGKSENTPSTPAS